MINCLDSQLYHNYIMNITIIEIIVGDIIIEIIVGIDKVLV